MAKRSSDWLDISMQAWMMGAEAGYVIWLRSMKVAMGGTLGESESKRMVEEKITANIALGFDIMTGKHGTSPESISRGTVGHYARRVSANRKRLTKMPR